MRRVFWMAAVATAFAVPAAGSAANIDPTHPPAGAVTALSIRAASGKAEVVIGFDGIVDVQDIAMTSPPRIVIDLKGATLKLLPKMYDGTVRGGIKNIRAAQQPGYVRIVLDLDREREYKVLPGSRDVRVTLDETTPFETWSVGSMLPQIEELVSGKTTPAITPVAAPVVPVRNPSGLSAIAAQQTARRITVTFRNQPLQDVLALFAEYAGVSIITAITNVNVTAEIVDQPWDVALGSILEAQGLVAVPQASGIVVVDTYANQQAKRVAKPLVKQIIAINYAKAAELAITLRQLLACESGPAVQVLGGPTAPAADAGAAATAGGAGAPPGASTGAGAAQIATQQTGQQPVQNAQGNVAPGPITQQLIPGPAPRCQTRGSVVEEVPTNSLIITEVADQIDSLIAYARAFDIKTTQVNIKAKFVSVNTTDTKQLGVSYDLGSANAFFNTLAPRTTTGGTPTEFQVTLGGDAFAGVANAGRQFKSGSALDLIYNTTIGNFSLTSFIDALMQENLSEITAEPSINTLDKRTATLFVGDHVAFLLTPPVAAGGLTNATPQISSLDVGITLTVTPSISANRMVRLTIVGEQSTLTSLTSAGPTYSKRTATAEVIVHDGETAVIAGLTQASSVKSRKGIPFLGQLPVLGKLFSENSDVQRKDDLLLLITPHILDDSIPAPRGHH